MENEILRILLRMIYNDKLLEAYENRDESIEFPNTIKLEANVKNIIDFNLNFFDKYKVTLIKNAVIYAIENKIDEYLKFVKNHIDNLNEVLENEIFFKTKTTELAFKNIAYKVRGVDKDGYLRMDTDLNNNTINKNKDLFNRISNNFIKIEFITSKYRKALFNFLNVYDISDMDVYLNMFLITDKLDNVFIDETDFVTKENINEFKKIIIRMILSDNYIQLETYMYEQKLDEKIDEILDKNDSANEEIEDEYDHDEMNDFVLQLKTLDFINKCIVNNKYVLPNDDFIRFKLINNFLVYNVDYDKSYDIETIEQNKKKKLNLLKINPFYKFDMFNKN